MKQYIPFFLILFLFSCEKESDHYIVVTPSELVVYAQSGEVLNYTISGYSEKGIHRLEVKLSPRNQLSISLLDSIIDPGVKKMNLTWEYMVPAFADTLMEAELNFIVHSTSGESVWNSKKIFISTKDYLKENEGFEIASSLSVNSQDHNAFSFFSLSTIQSGFADSSAIHIMDATDSTYSGGELSRKWISPAGTDFVKFNRFNYAKANLGNVINSFNSGVSSRYVDELKSKDIILVRYPDSGGYRYAVIKITSIIDEQDITNDRYIFNVKY